jgi:hypothetical protein
MAGGESAQNAAANSFQVDEQSQRVGLEIRVAPDLFLQVDACFEFVKITARPDPKRYTFSDFLTSSQTASRLTSLCILAAAFYLVTEVGRYPGYCLVEVERTWHTNGGLVNVAAQLLVRALRSDVASRLTMMRRK